MAKPADSYVYFFQAESGPVKIGVAADPMDRLSTVQNGNHEKIKIVALIPGGRELERELHRKFSAHRRHREWFSPAPEILALIEEHKGTPVPPRYWNPDTHESEPPYRPKRKFFPNGVPLPYARPTTRYL